VGLAAHASLCERLIAQIRRQEAGNPVSESRVEAAWTRATRKLPDSMPSNSSHCGASWSENRTQAAAAEQTYQELIRTRDVAIHEAQRRIHAVRSAIADRKPRTPPPTSPKWRRG
jgi:hypothetical protein